LQSFWELLGASGDHLGAPGVGDGTPKEVPRVLKMAPRMLPGLQKCLL